MNKNKVNQQQQTMQWSDAVWQAQATAAWRQAHEVLMQLPEARIARQWLDDRGIQPSLWVKYGLGYTNGIARPDTEQVVAPAVSVPWIVGGHVRAIRYLFLEPQGVHEQTLLPGSSVQGVLYGGHALASATQEQKTLLIVEGELNALCAALVAGSSNLDVLAVDRDTNALPEAFYGFAAKYKHVIFWLNRKELLNQASQKLVHAYQVHGAGKPSAAELHLRNRLGEALSRIRLKVAKTREHQHELLCDLLRAARNDLVGVDRGTVNVIQQLSRTVIHRERLTEVLPGHFVAGKVTAGASTTKTLFPVKPENIPQELLDIQQWIGYQLVPKTNAKTDKIPKNPQTKGNASVTAPATWSDFMTVLDFAYHSDDVDGVAIILSEQDNLVAIDIDDCVLADGSLKPEAQEIVTELNSYSEISPSGRGVHIFVFGKLPAGRRKHQKLGIEMYETERFMTVTGYHLAGTPAQVVERTGQLQTLHERVFGGQQQALVQDEPVEMPESDQQLWQSMFEASGGRNVRKLFEGDISVSRNDPSQAVIDLGNALASWTKKDRERMRRMFYQTSLKRDKWDERRGEITWLDYQINDCIAYTSRRK